MSKERELLERATEALKFWMDETAHSVDWELLEDLESYLASEKQDQPEPVQDEEPVAWVIPGGVTESKDLAEANGNSAKPLFLHPAPQRSFVRLSEEEMKACEPQLGIVKAPEGAKVDGLWIYDFARAIEDALEEKNK